MPFIKKNEFKIFSWGKVYMIDNNCIEKVKKIDEFREFIWASRAPIWLPLVLLSSILSGIICYFFYNDFEQIKEIAIQLLGIIYIIISAIYYIKLRNAINCKTTLQ